MEESPIVAGQAHDLREEMYATRTELEGSVYKMGLLLLKAQEAHYYRIWGYESIFAFAAAPVASGGLGIGSRPASRFMRICQFYIIERHLPMAELSEAGHTKLDFLIPIIKDEEEKITGDDFRSVSKKKANLIDRLVNEAIGNSQVDLMKTYIPKMVPAETSHQTHIANKSCPHCGKLIGAPVEER